MKRQTIPVIEKAFQKPIREILTELASKGDLEYIMKSLGIKKTLAYSLLKEFGIKPKKYGSQQKLPLAESELKSLVDDFLIDKKVSGRTEATIVDYGGNLERFMWWLKERGIPLQLSYAFTPEIIRHFLNYLQTEPIRYGGKCPNSRRVASATTLLSYWGTFQSFGAWLVKSDKIESSPFAKTEKGRKVEKPKIPKVIIPEIPGDIIKEILASYDNTFSGKRNKAIVLILLDTGIRLNELVELQINDLSLETGLAKVFGKGQKERQVRVGKVTREALVDYIAIRGNASPYLWLKENGTRFTREGIQCLFDKWNLKYPDIKISVHVFRHTFALSYLRGNGEFKGDPFTLQMLGGWETLEMPKRYVAAMKPEDAFKVHERASPADNLLGGK